ncbi:membrane protein [Sphingobium sp. TA15]|nr:membrane protein [Sphingobium sp. TA15]
MKKISKNALLRGSAALQVVAFGSAGLFAIVGASTAAMAQDYTRGNLVGTVVDQANAPVAGAEVSIKSNEQGFTRTATTDSAGVFRITALPTGSYSVTVTSGGTVVVEDNAVPVVAGQSNTYRYIAGGSSQQQADSGETIVVTGARVKTNDFAATTTGLTLNVQSLSESVPVARTLSSLALLAPGTSAGDTNFADCTDCVSFGGASIAENSYYVNGLNTTNFRTFVGNNTVPFEFYRTLDVKTGGWTAEYGRALGGVTSAVVKSGSNDFEAGAVVAFQPAGLTKRAPNTYLNAAGALKQRNDNDYNETIETNIYASGPIIKDRLFFYALYTPRYVRDDDSVVSSGYRQKTTSKSPFFGGKLDAIITDGHRLEATYFRDQRHEYTDYLPLDPVTGDVVGRSVGREDKEVGGDNFIVQYTGQFTNWFTLSGAWGQNNYKRRDVLIGDAGPTVQSTLNGSLQTVSGIPLSPTDSQDRREVFRADADFYFNLMGSHHLRVGFDREDLSAKEDTFYTQGVVYRYTPNYIRTRYYLNSGQFKTKQTAFYAQDSWDLLNDRLNLQIGVRNDRFQNYGITGEEYLDIKNQWAQRLGASFDVFGDKLTKINAFWGRYYLPVATNTNIRLAGAETFYEQRYAYPIGVNPGSPAAGGAPANPQTTANGTPLLGALTGANALDCPDIGPGAGQLCSTVLSDGIAGPTDTLVSQNLKPMFQEEFIIGATHRFNDWTVGLRYINRRLKETLEDVAIDAAVLDYCDTNGISGCGDVWSGFHQYVLANPGKDITVRLDGDCTIAGQCDVVTLTSQQLRYPKPVRKYDAVEFTLSKAFNGTFGFDFSYTWQKLRGNYEGSVKSDNNQDDAGLTQDFDQPGLTDGAFGTLANARKHTFKLFGQYKPAEWVTLGTNVTVQSPRSFSCIGVHPTDEFAQGYQAASFYCANPAGNGGSTDSTLVPRGSSFKGNWFKNVDLGIQFQLPKELGRSSFRVDVFNIFNWKSKLDYVEFGENDDGSLRDDFRFVTGYQAPRAVRFTWALRFGGGM